MAKDNFERKKPHVNVGTIGHIDHGKTTTHRRDPGRAGRQGLGSDQVLCRHRQGRYRPRRNQDRDHRRQPRRIRDRQASLRPHRLPGPRRLHQEHDHRRRPDGRRDPGGFGRRRPDAANPRAHPVGPPGRRAGAGRVPEQGRPGRRRGAARAGRAGTARAAHALRLPGRRNPDHPRRLEAGLRQPEGSEGQQVHRRPDGRHRHLHSRAGARNRQAVPDGRRRRVLDRRPRHGRPPAVSSAASSRSARKSRSSACRKSRERRSAPAWKCSTRRSTRVRPATTSACCCAASSAKKSSAARCWPSPAPSRRTPSSRPRCTSCRRKKVAGTRRSSAATVRSSTSARPT